jgi:hypothetical protein
LQFYAFSKDILQKMTKIHEQTIQQAGIKRGPKLEALSSGKMVGIGGRAPIGGRSGDSYNHYAQTVVKDNWIEEMFDHGDVNHCKSHI